MPLRHASVLIISMTFAATYTAEARAADPPAYEVYAVRYATLPDFPVAALVQGAERGRKLDIAMMIWVLKGPDGRIVLVDAGYYRPQFLKSWKASGYTRPDQALEPLGIRPEQVTDIVVTHMHWDHADGVDLFPKARVWIQKDEFAYYSGAAWQPGGQPGGVDPEDVLALVKLNTQGRVSLVNGDAREIFPGVTVYTGGRHTFASQYVGVNTKAGRAVIASDNLYLYENLDKHAPIAQTFDAQFEPGGAGPHETARGEPAADHPGPRPGGLRPVPEAGQRRGAAGVGYPEGPHEPSTRRPPGTQPQARAARRGPDVRHERRLDRRRRLPDDGAGE